MSRTPLSPAFSHLQIGAIERLEARIAPAVIATVTGQTLHLTGDGGDNLFAINAVAGDQTVFSITSGVDTINGSASAFITPSGIKNIVINFKAGADSVNIGNAGAITLLGSLKINGGAGDNEIKVSQLFLGGNLKVNNADGFDSAVLEDAVIKGSVKIANGDGGSDTGITSSLATRRSAILGNLTVINGTGEDSTYTEDTSIGGNVTVINGRADTDGDAGYTNFYNDNLTDQLSTIGGNIFVSYANGTVDYDGIWDTNVRGNVRFDYGKAIFTTYFDGYSTDLATVIQGKLSISGTGYGAVNVGEQYQETGLVVERLAISLSQGASGILDLSHLEVSKNTDLTIRGADTLNINDSIFHGDFSYTTGGGGNTVSIEQRTGTSVGTLFEGAVDFDFNNGGTTFGLAGFSDANQAVTAYRSIIIHKGGGGLEQSVSPAQIFFPFGGELKLLP